MAQEGRDEKGRFIRGNKLSPGKGVGGRPSFKIDNMMLAIQCKDCGEVKNYIDFPKVGTKTGINRKCIKCTYNSYHRLTRNIKGRIYSALKEVDSSKNTRTIHLLGLSINEYKDYLESLFTKRMSWDNYGVYWEIDHIIPLSRFDLDDEYQQKQAFNYTNTRPLTTAKNRAKKDKLTEPQYKIIL